MTLPHLNAVALDSSILNHLNWNKCSSVHGIGDGREYSAVDTTSRLRRHRFIVFIVGACRIDPAQDRTFAKVALHDELAPTRK